MRSVSMRQRHAASICATSGSQNASLASLAHRQPSRSPGAGRDMGGILALSASAARASALIVVGGSIVRAGSTTGVSPGAEATAFILSCRVPSLGFPRLPSGAVALAPPLLVGLAHHAAVGYRAHDGAHFELLVRLDGGLARAAVLLSPDHPQ